MDGKFTEYIGNVLSLLQHLNSPIFYTMWNYSVSHRLQTPGLHDMIFFFIDDESRNIYVAYHITKYAPI